MALVLDPSAALALQLPDEEPPPQSRAQLRKGAKKAGVALV